MSIDWRQWIKDKGLEKWFRRDNFIVLVLVGILLFVIALPVKEKDEDQDTEDAAGEKKTTLTLSELGEGNQGADLSGVVGGDGLVREEYAAYMEKRLTDALSKMADVGKVEVMITLKTSQELVVEKEQPLNRSNTNENDSQGGSRVVNQLQTEENTVYRTDGSLSEPYVIKTIPPQIEGVLVVAEGAGKGNVNLTIAEIVQTLFGVDAHKVKVVKMEVRK